MSFSFLRHWRRILFWLVVALWKRYQKSLVFTAIFGFFFFIFVFSLLPRIKSALSRSKVQRIGLVGNFDSTNFPFPIQNQISLGLTAVTPAGEATPAAALHWEVFEKGNVYTFHLREDLFWHDGTKFKAQDIDYNFKDVKVKVLDEHTLQFFLPEPFAPFPVLTSQPLFKAGLSGLGAYQVKKIIWKKGFVSSLTIVPKKVSGAPLIYKFYPSEKAALLAFKLGEVETLWDIANPIDLDKWPTKIEKKIFFNRVAVIFYNTQASLLSEKTLRQSLTSLLPTFEEIPAISPLNPNSWAYNKNVKKYNFNEKVARDFFGKSKTATGSGEKKLVLITNPDLAERAKEIAKNWQKLNLQVEVKVENLIPQDFQALFTIWEIPPDPDQYSLWHSTQEKTNLSHYQNPRIDKLLEDGRKLQSPEERLLKYLDFQKYLVDDAPAAFLYYPESYTISRR